MDNTATRYVFTDKQPTSLLAQRPTMIVALYSLFSLISISQATPPNHTDALHKIAAHVRVGNAKTALNLLKRHQKPSDIIPEEEDVRILLKTQSHLLLAQPEQAIETLEKLPAHSKLQPIALTLKLRAFVARNQDNSIPAVSKKLVSYTSVPLYIKAEARYYRALSMMKTTAYRTLGLKLMKKLLSERSSYHFQAKILWQLITYHPDQHQRKQWIKQLLIEHGSSPEGKKIQQQYPNHRLTEKQQIKRVKNLLNNWANDLALQDLMKLMKSTSPATKQYAQLTLGIIKMRERTDYPQALTWLQSARSGPNKRISDDAWYRSGLMLGNLQRWDQSIATMKRLLTRRPYGSLPRRAAYQVGRLQHQGEMYTGAAQDIATFARKYTENDPKWRWFAGFSYFRNKQYPEARKVWNEFRNHRGLEGGSRALYWTARAYLAQNKTQEAKATLQKLRTKASVSYYGLLGAGLYRKHFDTTASYVPKRKSRIALPKKQKLTQYASKNTKLYNNLHTIELFVTAGFPDFARRFNQQYSVESLTLKANPANKHGAIKDQFHLWLERWSKRYSSKADKMIHTRDGFVQKSTIKARHAFPPAYYDLAVAAGSRYGISPWWLIAHMLKESRFREQVSSPAGAIGAMQILPSTGRSIAEASGIHNNSFHKSMLLRPGTSLQQAAWYLDALRTEYRGTELLAIAAYNGGPRRISEYLHGANGKLPMDMFVEEIGAHETRKYTRRVMTILIRYLHLYANDDELQRFAEELVNQNTPQPRGKLRF